MINVMTRKPSKEAEFFALVAQKCGTHVSAAIRQIYEWAHMRVGLSWGRGKNLAFHMRHRRTGRSILHIAADGWGWLYLKELRKVSPFEEDQALLKLLDKLKSIPGLNFQAGGNEILGFDLRQVSAPEVIHQILDVVGWAVKEMDKAAVKS
jgi:hypothetical protein